MIAAFGWGWGLPPEYAVGPAHVDAGPGVSPPTPANGHPSTAAGPRGHHGAMTPAAGTDAPPLADPPPVVGGRFAPIMGLRRNAVDYAESMWRRHGDLVHMVVGPPGSSRDVWWVHHPDGAARVLSGSSWRAYSKQDQVHDEIARWLGPGLLTAEGEDWTRQKRFLQPLFTKAAVDGYADLMVHEIETVVGEWDTGGSATVDLRLQMQRLTLRVVLAALFGDAADDVLPHVRHSFPAVSDTILRRGLGAVRLPAGIPTRRVRRGRAARDELSGCATPSSPRAARGAPPVRPTCSASCSPPATVTSG